MSEAHALLFMYRGTSFIRNNLPVGTYRSLMPRDLW